MADTTPKPIHVKVTDPETGETQEADVWNDFLIICAGDRYLANITRHANGTTVLTVKKGEAR